MPAPNLGSELNAREVYRVVAPSVYLVVAASGLEADQSANLGSAVAINEHLALTNCHVIEENTYIAMFDDADNRLDATVWARNSEDDRCILETDQTLHPIRSGRRSENVEIGETVYTIGNPEAFRSSLAEGIVSGVRQEGGVSYIQTTAPISHGSSGGALVDSRGNLLGITTFFAQDAQNLNFAIAMEEFWAAPPKADEQALIPDAPFDPDMARRLQEFDHREQESASHDPPLTTPLRALYDAYVSLTDEDRANAGVLAPRISEFAGTVEESNTRLAGFAANVTDGASEEAFRAYDTLTMFDKILYQVATPDDVFIKVCEAEGNLALQTQRELRLCRDPSLIVPVNGAWGQRSLVAARKFLDDARYWEWIDKDMDLTIPSIQLRDLVRRVRAEGYGPVCAPAAANILLPKIEVAELCRRRLSERR
jgi:hypothetical protein